MQIPVIGISLLFTHVKVMISICSYPLLLTGAVPVAGRAGNCVPLSTAAFVPRKPNPKTGRTLLINLRVKSQSCSAQKWALCPPCLCIPILPIYILLFAHVNSISFYDLSVSNAFLNLRD